MKSERRDAGLERRRDFEAYFGGFDTDTTSLDEEADERQSFENR